MGLAAVIPTGAPQRATIEEEIRAKEAWRTKWFHEVPDGASYLVIVASPCGEPAAQVAIEKFNRQYPDVFFELWCTVGECFFGVTVGAGLSESEATHLLSIVRRKGMEGYLWRS